MATPKPIPHPPAFVPDERQREAIEHLHGPILVVAGAGTGKTTVLTRRIARLIRDGGIRPDQILATTYTENAAQEMRERVQGELRGVNLKGLQIETFHAYCNNLLARCGKQFGVLDEKDLWIYLRKHIRDLQLEYFIRAANLGQFLEDLIAFMSRCQDELVSPEKYSAYVRRLETGELPIPRVGKSKDAAASTDEDILARCREIAAIYTKVDRMLRDENLGSFGHMLTRAHDLLDQDAALLAREREHARFILVDEFQDANFAQVKILQKLAGEERNVFAVGDPDQAIFRFRGASSAAFGLFQRNFPGARLVALDKNRRSTTSILKCAFALVSKNAEIFPTGKNSIFPYKRAPLVSARDEDAARESATPQNLPVESVTLAAKEIECSDLVTTIRQRQKQSRCAWRDFAILYRQHMHRDLVANELAVQEIPFSIENMDVMDTPEARDLFACLGAVVSTADGASLFRVAALPQFAIDPEKLRAGMKAIPRDADSAVALVLAKTEGGPAVLDEIQSTRDEVVRTNATGSDAVDIVIRHFKLDRGSRPLQAVLEFIAKWEEKPVTKTGEIAELLEYLEYFREARGAIPMPSRDEDAVRLITAHAAKGLEFNHVFILRATSPSFPSSYRETLVEFPRDLRDPDSIAQDEDKELHNQEERRLFYVAMTRARDSLTIYAQQGRGKDPTPPGFLRDLLKDSGLSRWLRSRPARPFQTEIFAQAGSPMPVSRTSEWLSLPPASDLQARLSASAVQTYGTCPLQFKLQREWKIPREAPAAMQYGASMHRVLHAYYDSVRWNRPMSEDALIELFRTDLTNAHLQDHYQHELYEKQGIEQLRELLRRSKSNPVPSVLHTEEPFEVKIGSATVVGRIDRIDQLSDRVVITDYKTGKPQTQDDADESLQLSVYAIAAREKWGYQTDHLAFYNLTENAAVITRRDEHQLDQARMKVEETAKNIAEGKFDPRPGFYCSFCNYRNLCPATEKRLYTLADKKTKREN